MWDVDISEVLGLGSRRPYSAATDPSSVPLPPAETTVMCYKKVGWCEIYGDRQQSLSRTRVSQRSELASQDAHLHGNGRVSPQHRCPPDTAPCTSRNRRHCRGGEAA